MHSDNGRPTNITTDQTLTSSHAQTDKVLYTASEMTCIVSSGALNSTHSLTVK